MTAGSRGEQARRRRCREGAVASRCCLRISERRAAASSGGDQYMRRPPVRATVDSADRPAVNQARHPSPAAVSAGRRQRRVLDETRASHLVVKPAAHARGRRTLVSSEPSRRQSTSRPLIYGAAFAAIARNGATSVAPDGPVSRPPRALTPGGR